MQKLQDDMEQAKHDTSTYHDNSVLLHNKSTDRITSQSQSVADPMNYDKVLYENKIMKEEKDQFMKRIKQLENSD